MAAYNVVFIVADQHRFDFMGYEQSNGRTDTPHLNTIARHGTLFRSAYCNAPLCGPSRLCLASGRYGMNTGCYTNLHELPPHTPTFIEQFRKHGYRTCAIGKTHMEIHAYDSDLRSYRYREFMRSLGWDEGCEVSGNGMLRTGIRCAYSEWLRERGLLDEVAEFYAHWNAVGLQRPNARQAFEPLEWPFPEECQETAFIGRSAVEWIRKRDQARPFFLHVGFAAPHSPIHPLPEYLEPYRQALEPKPWGLQQDPEWIMAGRRGYRAMITHVDRYVGEIQRVLSEQGILNDTLIVYTADHGEMAGDHGATGKELFYEGSIRIPLVIAGPGVRQGHASGALIELIDLGKTLCECCGVQPHALDLGRSLAPLLRGETDVHRATVYSEMMCDRMLFDGRYKLMFGDPSTERRTFAGPRHTHKPANIAPNQWRLYDLHDDPHELTDLAKDGGKQELAFDLLRKLLARINENTQALPWKQRGEPRPIPKIKRD